MIIILLIKLFQIIIIFINKFYLNVDNLNISIDSDNLLLYFKKHLDNKQYLLLYEIINDNHKLMFDINDYPKELHDECTKK